MRRVATRSRIHLCPVLLLALLGLSTSALAAGDGASGTLQPTTTFRVKDTRVSCPEGNPQSAACFLFVGDADVPGLGHVTEKYTRMVDSAEPECVRTLPTAVIEVAGKGQIDAALSSPRCVGLPPIRLTFAYEITGGSGAYAGASGNIQVSSQVSTTTTHLDTWSGTLTVPGLEFDLDPPTFRGAVSKTVRAPRKAKRVRVKYAVSAEDAVDGSVRATCTPRSGAFFKVGRSRVRCKATDSSANTGTARFTVTVTRVRRGR